MTLRERFEKETGWKIDDSSPETQPYCEYSEWLETRVIAGISMAISRVVDEWRAFLNNPGIDAPHKGFYDAMNQLQDAKRLL